MSNLRRAPQEADPAVPASVIETYSGEVGWSWDLIWSYEGKQSSWRLSHPSEPTLYCKVGRSDLVITVADDCERTRWAYDYLPVPRIIDCGTAEGVDWMVNTGLPGVDATSERFRDDPESLVTTLARGLRRFHEAPVDGCPFDFRLDTQMAHVRRRVAEGKIDPTDMHEEFTHHTPASALETLERLMPADEDLVVCHSDYCLPNIMVIDGEVVGYMDLGELGVSDRWWDIAVGAWSVTWNLGPGHEDRFYGAYGIEPDPDRIAFYRLLYDLVS